MVATTLTVVSCLHRHASLDSMREVETVQPLASPPTFGGTINGTPPPTRSNAIIFRTRRRSDHKVQSLDDLGGHVLVAVELDVLRPCGAHRAPAGEPGELQRVNPDSRRRFQPAEVFHPLSAPIDA